VAELVVLRASDSDVSGIPALWNPIAGDAGLDERLDLAVEIWLSRSGFAIDTARTRDPPDRLAVLIPHPR
jgi:hypothetical protein